MKRLLFVCIGNSCRSQMGQAFAKIHGSGIVEAYSAGTNPSGTVGPIATEAMREVGYDLGAHRSKSITEVSDMEYDWVITMGCGDDCPSVRAKNRQDWALPDPKYLPIEELRPIRDAIETKVKELIAEIDHD